MLGREPSDVAVQQVAERAFRNYGRVLLDFVRIGSAGADEVMRRVSYEGEANIDAALSRGCGAILAVPHMGCWDMGGAAIGVLGYPTYAVAEVFPGSLNDAVVETRQKFGLRVIPLDRSAVRRVQDALRENAVVALVCDLEHGPGITVDFFGHPAVVPSGPASFALKTGAPVLTGHMYRVGDSNYHAVIDGPVEAPSSGDRQRDVHAIMQAVICRFEGFISARPDQWFAFRPVFRVATQPSVQPQESGANSSV